MSATSRLWEVCATMPTLFVELLDESRGGRSPTWRRTVAAHLHADALLEDLRRRGGPRTAREFSERDWLRQELDPAIVAAAITARATHRALHPAKRPRAPRAPRRSLATLYARALLAEQDGLA